MRFFQDLSLASFSAGFVAVLVGFTSTIAIVFQAALAFGATPAQVSSWLWALGIGMGLCCMLPSLWLRLPVMVAWSTPGAAVLATAGLGGAYSMGEAVGAFMLSAVLIILFGVTGWFERVMNRLPLAIASGLLAGVLARFGMQAFVAAQTALPLVLVMLASYLLGRRFLPRYAVPLTLLIAIIFVAMGSGFKGAAPEFSLTVPVFVMPVFTWSAAISLALPLFVVTMASQNLPGVAAIQASGYGRTDTSRGFPVSGVITLTGLATLVLAPFGGFALNLSAITAAICMGPEAHPDPKRRYTAAVSCGAIYLLIGLFGAAIVAMLNAFPRELIAAIAGLALLGTIGNALHVALREDKQREAALVTFLVTLSGVVIAGVGAAFWGVLAGAFTLFVQQYRTSTEKP
jgi:benzoate membrane transport protein